MTPPTPGGDGTSRLDPELEDVVRTGTWLGTSPGADPTLSFTALFLALLVRSDEFSQWIQDLAGRTGLTTQAILDHWKERGAPADATPGKLDRARSVANAPMPQFMTPSATEILRVASSFAASASPGGLASSRHVLAAYVYRPPGHLDDYLAWKFDRRAWAKHFGLYMQRRFPAEASFWRNLDESEFAANPATYNVGLHEALAWGAALEQLRSPDRIPVVGAHELFVGVLLDGVAATQDDIPSKWLVGALRTDPLALLGATALPPRAKEATYQLAPDAKAILARSTEIAELTVPPQRRTYVIHVIGAFLTLPLSPETARLLDQAGTTQAGLRDQFATWLARRSSPVEMAAWTRVLTVAVPDRFAGYDNDDARGGTDRLGFRRDVEAMAAVLASREITPPLSIGLFGDWGSGKSFFMNQLEDRIKALAEASRAAVHAKQPTSYCGEIIQIGFNAWQYMDGNLWASLVAHIFDQLNQQLTKQNKKTADDFATELASVVERKDELRREKDALGAAMRELDISIDRKRTEREAKQLTFSQILARLVEGKEEAVNPALEKLAEQLGVDRAKVTLEEARAEKLRLEHLAGRVVVWWRTIRKSPAKAALAFLFVLVPIAVAALTTRFPNLMGETRGVIATLTTVLGSLVALGSWVRARATPIAGMIDNALARADEAERDVRAKVSLDEQRLAAERAEILTAQAHLERERATLTERQATIEGELQALKDGRSFKKYVLERAASDDYRKQLGLIATIHRDFRALSVRLGNAADEPYVERIVLYIDDLDRCPPDRVVEVLQAVHLILSLPLFVVVVAVDSRWLLRSLEAYYAKQFSGGDGSWESKPQHYLEKIFQIPFALRPTTASWFKDLIGAMLEKQIASQQGRNPPSTPVHRDVETTGASAPRAKVATAPNAGADDRVTKPDGAALGPSSRPEQHPSTAIETTPVVDLTPRNLEIGRTELQFLETMAPLVSTPRAAKRLVNLYRIVRATLSDADLPHFVGGRYKTTQLLLASVVGSPSLAAEMFGEILAGRLNDGSALKSYLDAKASLDTRWSSLARLLGGGLESVSGEELREIATAAARYSFETGRLFIPRSAPNPSTLPPGLQRSLVSP